MRWQLPLRDKVLKLQLRVNNQFYDEGNKHTDLE